MLSSPTFSQNSAFKQEASADSLKKNLTFLASDSLKGRSSISKEQQVATSFIASSFKQYGLKGATSELQNPFLHSFYFTSYPFPTTYKVSITETNRSISPYSTIFVASSKAFTSRTFTPYIGKSDLMDQSLDTKTVWSETLPNGLETVKDLLAKNGNAKTFLVAIPDSVFKIYSKARQNLSFANAAYTNADSDTILMGWSNDTNKLSENIYHNTVQAFVKKHPGVTLLITTESTLKAVFTDSIVETYVNGTGTAIGKSISVNGDVKADGLRFRKVANVAAILDGSTKKDEVVVVCAHFDHIGITPQKQGKYSSADSICNGADDNASGTSAIMETARLFSNAKENGFTPQRSIVFVAFTGEEVGLCGSRYMMLKPFIDLKNIKATINLDMVGRTDAQHFESDMYAYALTFGDTLSLQKMAKQAAKAARLRLSDEMGDYERKLWTDGSDHAPFVQNGIPAIAITTGMHPDYHKPSDEVDKINFKRLERITTFTYYLAWELANQ